MNNRFTKNKLFSTLLLKKLSLFALSKVVADIRLLDKSVSVRLNQAFMSSCLVLEVGGVVLNHLLHIILLSLKPI